MGAGTPCLTAMTRHPSGTSWTYGNVTYSVYDMYDTRWASNAALTEGFRPRNDLCFSVILTAVSTNVKVSATAESLHSTRVLVVSTSSPRPGAVKVATAAENQSQSLSYLIV